MKKHSLKLQSSITEIHKLEKFVEEICDEYNINNSYFGNILLSLTEAFENALFHGNKSNPAKLVKISFESKPKGLLFEVHDEGKGFDFNNIPDATDIEGNPEKRGAGLFMIKSLADEIHFSDQGRCIQILFYISSINQQIAIDRIQSLNSFIKSGKEEKAKKS
jgi:serine/threonine-protein kinase RsbW